MGRGEDRIRRQGAETDRQTDRQTQILTENVLISYTAKG